jgi:hypothetical protein
LQSDFGGIKTPPDPERIAYSAFYEVVVPDTVFRAEFLHSLGRELPDLRGSQFDPQRAYAIARSGHSEDSRSRRSTFAVRLPGHLGVIAAARKIT